MKSPNESDFYKKIVLNINLIYIKRAWCSIISALDVYRSRDHKPERDLCCIKNKFEALIKYLETDELNLRDKSCLDYLQAHLQNVISSLAECEAYILDNFPQKRNLHQYIDEAWNSTDLVENNLYCAQKLLEEEVKSNV